MGKDFLMIQEYNKKSFVFGIPGIILQIAGNFMRNPDGVITGLGALIILSGTALLIVGLVFYAKAKGRHPAWCLFAFLSIIGLLVLALLKDHSQTSEPTE